MPHAVETMFYVREVPWHRLGTEVESAPTSERALELAGLDWEVEKEPLWLPDQLVDGYWATVRATDRKVLGIVKERYRVLQNRDAFAFTDALLGHGVKYETAGSLHGGRRVWIQARMPKLMKLLKDDVLPYLCITNSHDGEGAIKVVVTPVRVVCQNTLSLAVKKASRSWSARHTGNLRSKVQAAEEALGLSLGYMKALGERAEILAQIRVPAVRWREVVAELFPLPKNPKTPNLEFLLKLAEERRALLHDLFWTEDLKPYRETAWAAVNALIDFADHTERVDARSNSAEVSMARILDDGQPLVEKGLALLKITA